MAAIPYPPPPTASLSDNDIFSISDAHLAQRYQFIREVGIPSTMLIAMIALLDVVCRLVQETGDVCGYVAQGLVIRMHIQRGVMYNSVSR